MPSEKLEKNPKIVIEKFKMDPQIRQNNSQQDLVPDSEDVSDQKEKTLKDLKFREWTAVFILCFVNLINYMDRFTIAGVLTELQNDFKIQNDKGGLLQTAFIISYMVFGPIFGYCGDRYSRKWLMAGGVFLWSVTTLVGSFMTNYWWFLLFRGLVGIGEASYSTIAPTIISDLFVGNIRSKMLAMFYFAIPVGSGLGYIVGSETAKLAGSWHWALRVTPSLGIVAVLLIAIILIDPERGQSECSGHMEVTPWSEDIKDIVHNRSFMLSTAGFTCVAFVTGALAWWGPKFIEMGLKLQPNGGDVDPDSVAYKFGVISMIAGLAGVPSGTFVAQKLRYKYPRIDAHVCAFGLLVSSPLIFLSCVTARYSVHTCFALVFFAMFFLNLNWSLVADIVMHKELLKNQIMSEVRSARSPASSALRRWISAGVASISILFKVSVSSSLLLGDLFPDALRLFIFNNSFLFGAITVVTGLIGLSSGAFLSGSLKPRFPRIDPIICSIGLISSSPFLFATTYAAPRNTAVCYVLLFLGQLLLNLNWAIISDMTMYVVVPTRRSTAQGFQLLVSHALGDAGSPYLIGVISEAFKISLGSSSSNSTTSNTDLVEFKSLQYALFITCFVEIIGGLFFLINAFYILQDKRKVDQAIHAGNTRRLLMNNPEIDQGDSS